MKIIKRNGSEAEFNLEKIRIAVTKANNTVPEHLQMKRLKYSLTLQDLLIITAMYRLTDTYLLWVE